MVGFAALGTTLGIINGAAVVAKTAHSAISKRATPAIKAYQRAGAIGGSITSVTAQTTILSRVFIEEAILDEPLLPNLLRTLHEWYAAQIIAALRLSQMVDDMRSVQHVMSLVQSGHTAKGQNVLGNIQGRLMAQESFVGFYLGEAAMEAMFGPPIPPGGYAQTHKAALARAEDAETELEKMKSAENNVTIRSVKTSENRIGPMGELYEVTLTNPDKLGRSLTIPVFVQMQPSIIPSKVAARFVDLNVSPTIWQRWTQMSTGEITFWKDFLLHRDLIQRQMAIVKDPEAAAAFQDFLKTVNTKDVYALQDVTSKSAAPGSSNLANSVLIITQEAADEAKSVGVDLHHPADRQRYFRDTYAMIVVIVDTIHQRLTIYFNGIDGDIDASYMDFKPKDTKFDPKDFMAALQAFSGNNISRLR